MNGNNFPTGGPPAGPPQGTPNQQGGPHRVPVYPGAEFNHPVKGQPPGPAGGMGPMFEMNAQFGNFPPQAPQAIAPYNNGHMTPGAPPPQPMEEGMDFDNSNRHQMMNNRLKTLIQSRQTQKEMGHMLCPFPVQQVMMSDMQQAGTPPEVMSYGMTPDAMAGGQFQNRNDWGQMKGDNGTNHDGRNEQDGENMFSRSMDSQSFNESLEEQNGDSVNGVESYTNFYNAESMRGDPDSKASEEGFDNQNHNSNTFSPSSSCSSAQSFPSSQQMTHENNGLPPQGTNGTGEFLHPSTPQPFSPNQQRSSPFPLAPPTSTNNHSSPPSPPSSSNQPESSAPPPASSPGLFNDRTPDKKVEPQSPANSVTDVPITLNNVTPPVSSVAQTVHQSTEPQPFLSNTTTSMSTFTSTISTYNSLSSPLPSVSHLFGRPSAYLLGSGDKLISSDNSAPKSGGGMDNIDAGRIDTDSRGFLDSTSSSSLLPSFPPYPPSSQFLIPPPEDGMPPLMPFPPPPGMQDAGWWERVERLRTNARMEIPPCHCYGDDEREYSDTASSVVANTASATL